ncbi:RDD family protein [Hymenobacter elongatus]|uniref:RDD family protein n=1 Tax=Hymenobacter elongatus TaxID=877208 RepID=A0A4Z0PMU0_9BACT|nr:RDD family protein [Hymenobacter elongatus]TGE16270.1 RDD family protein [Hymenobacter elongatus]
MSTIRIQTTQNVTLEYEVASISDRIGAALIDYALYFAWFMGWVFVTAALNLDLGSVGMFLVFLPTLFYHLACEVFFNGQSLGKKALHSKVVRLDGTRPGLGDYLLRWILRPIDILSTSGALALITILLNGRGQRLGDLAAGTSVVSLRPRRAAASPLAPPAPAPGYVVVFPQAAQLTDHDVALVRQLLDRGLQQQNYLLLNEVATKIKGLTGIRTDLHDEAFLRTILRDHAHIATTA